MKQIFPSGLKNTRIYGYVGNTIDSFAYHRITSDFAKKVICREAEDVFRTQPDDVCIPYYWKGEFWGKWIISAVRYYEYCSDETLKEFIHQSALTLIGYQDERGYLGTYKNSLNVFSTDPAIALKEVGWECVWNWNIWCRKYTLWGLIEAYRLTHDKQIITAAKRHASFLIDELAENNINIADTGVLAGLPSCSILKPMVLLYEITREQKYLNFALNIAEQFDDGGRAPDLFTKSAAGIPLHKWHPHPEKWAKAYELMSCLEGLIALYKTTLIEKYLDAVKNTYNLIEKYDSNAVCSVAYNDMFIGSAGKSNAVSEPCDAIHWCRLSYELFSMTGECNYIDNFEKTFYNCILGSVSNHGKWGNRCVVHSNRHDQVVGQAGMHYQHCCVNNLPRGFMDMAEVLVMHNEDEIYINLYNESNTVVSLPGGETSTVRISGEYLGRGTVCVEVGGAFEREITLCLRIPVWSKKTVVRVGGEPSTLNESGMYYKVTVTGETNIDLQFDPNPRISEEFADASDADDAYVIKRWESMFKEDVRKWGNTFSPKELMLKKPKSRIFVGPLLLALSKRIDSTEEEMFGEDTIFGKGFTVKSADLIYKESDFQAVFELTLNNGSETVKKTMCDFASANPGWSDDIQFHTIYI